MQKTLVIIKPDGVGKKAAGEIIARFEAEGFTIAGLKMVRPDRSTIERFYDVHRERPFFGPLVEFMLSGPIIPMVLKGDDAVARVRALIGATNAKEAAPGTIRNRFGTDNRKNVVHASDSDGNAEREIAFYFSPEEQFDYDPDAWESR